MVSTHKPIIRPALILVLVAGLPLAGCGVPKLSMTRDTPAPLLVAPLRQPAEAIPPDGMVTVREGDTVYALAARYGVPPTSIISDNQIGPPYSVFPGQQLRLTPQRTHLVGPEDSIYTISQRYAVSQYQLAEANGLEVPFELRVGQRLILPASQDFSVLDSAPDATATNVAALAPKVASAPGTVAFVGREIKSFGTLVLVKHDGGIITAYAHLGDVMVREGDVIEAGQQIATVGLSGKVDTPQLHFEIRKAREPVDPRTLIA